MSDAEEGPVVGRVGFALAIVATALVAVGLYVAGGLAVSTSPVALFAAAVGLTVGAAVQYATYNTERGANVEAWFRDHWLLGLLGLLVVAQVASAVLAQVRPGFRLRSPVPMQFLFAAFFGAFVVQVRNLLRSRDGAAAS